MTGKARESLPLGRAGTPLPASARTESAPYLEARQDGACELQVSGFTSQVFPTAALPPLPMSDPNAEFDHAVLDKIEASPTGAVPGTPAYQDSLRRLYAARQVYASADHAGGHVTARSLAALPTFHAANLGDFLAGKITDEALESNKSIYDRYVASLPAAHRARAESYRLAVIGKPILHRAKHGVGAVHDPLHMLFLVPGAGPHPGLPGNYLHGAVFHVGDEVTGAWLIEVHDREDGASSFRTPKLPEALAKLEEVLASAPFELHELDALGFKLT